MSGNSSFCSFCREIMWEKCKKHPKSCRAVCAVWLIQLRARQFTIRCVVRNRANATTPPQHVINKEGSGVFFFRKKKVHWRQRSISTATATERLRPSIFVRHLSQNEKIAQIIPLTITQIRTTAKRKSTLCVYCSPSCCDLL